MTAYIIARIEVTDPEDYKLYAAQTVAMAGKRRAAPCMAKGGAMTQVEGSGPDRHVLIRLSDAAAALGTGTNRTEYQGVLPNCPCGAVRGDLVIVDGV